MEYKPRLKDEELAFLLECSGAVLIPNGAAKPSLLLAGDNPRLIDEWQEAPVLWDAVRLSVDGREAFQPTIRSWEPRKIAPCAFCLEATLAVPR